MMSILNRSLMRQLDTLRKIDEWVSVDRKSITEALFMQTNARLLF